ncbi:MAG: methylmalonyl Co-A mutase-associated GTPase MeaB, partial [Muribaculaceae bacterium]|nr:methylmalonyl Co-A mutase-associated GTPase MeaB [Muribaculaceae bacterium]
PEVLCYSGYYETGIDEVWDMIDRYFQYVKANGYFDIRRREQARYWMFETINEQLRNNFYNNPEIERRLFEAEGRVLHNEVSSFVAAKDVIDFYFNNLKTPQ